MNSDKKIRNYAEYVDKLRQEFGSINGRPKEIDIKNFITKYNLYEDWGIHAVEVDKDIMDLILLISYKKISSYKQYLEALKGSFGISEYMPKVSEISDFICKYDLYDIWGITENDVAIDLLSFMHGKYEEMYREAIMMSRKNISVESKKKYTPQVVLKKQNTTIEPQKAFYKRNIVPRKHSVDSIKISILPKSNFSTSVRNKKSAGKVVKKKKEIIRIDGDNHINEAVNEIEKISEQTRVVAYFSQPGAKRKFDKRYDGNSNFSSKLVKPGDQAVDNQIKTDAGRDLQEGKKITILSHDSGFIDYKKKKKKKIKIMTLMFLKVSKIE